MRRRMLAVGVLLGASVAARADYTYTYVGSDFAYVGAPYTTADRVTGTMTFATPFEPGIGYYQAQPLSFSFSDGVQTLTQANALSYEFDFDTYESPNPATGNLNGWNINIVGSEYPDPYRSQPYTTGITLDAYYDAPSAPFGGDSGSVPGGGYGISNGPGMFTEVSPGAQTPEPATLALLGTGLAGLVGVVRRRG